MQACHGPPRGADGRVLSCTGLEAAAAAAARVVQRLAVQGGLLGSKGRSSRSSCALPTCAVAGGARLMPGRRLLD